MSDFDGLIKDDEPEREPDSTTPHDVKPKINPNAKSLVEMLTDDGDIDTLGKKLNLDSEMTEKVLIPLINFLDKYGVGESLSTNPTVSQGADLVSFFTDVAPVVKSAAEYFQGKKQSLSDEDAAFLEKIKEAQNTESLSLFIGEEVDEEEVVEIEEVEAEESILTGINPFIHGIDWEEVLGVNKQFTEKSGVYGTIAANVKPTEFGIQGLETLAAEHGVSLSDVNKSDRQNRTNAMGGTDIDYTDGDIALDLGLDEIKNAMNTEQKRLSNTSKVNFDSDALEVPENIDTYDPMNVVGYVPPTLDGLDSIETLMENAQIDSFDDDEEESAEEVVVEFADDELVYNAQDKTYTDPNTGEVYEAVNDLTEVPSDYFGEDKSEEE